MEEPGGQDDRQAFHDAHKRIVAAFEGIASGAEALALRATHAPDPSELARLRTEVEDERVANAQLAERVRALRGRGGEGEAQDDRVAALESSLAQAQEEIAGLEALRAADRAEMDAVLAELMPIIEDAR